ncbi:hypothetical protein IAI10_14240 [Clostridium sp. 19966]|uniref:hypothetical protein n=1 Tax=Clostridium sp. 19966 TaxID=2768166 RepID=UPI0028DEF763|nr:hypothetical protein [Clostridium sp. 19966]MDT8717824.1 hypothetical protein [Clostridium sp. 19966]
MSGVREVILYSGLNYHEVLKLPVDTFMLMRKNAFVEKCMETEEGRKYLEDVKRLNMVEPDYEAVKEFQSKKGK